MTLVLLRLALIALIAWVLYRFLWRNEPPRKPRPPAPRAPGAVEEMRQDPVCGTWLPESQALKETIGNRAYYFCSPGCRDKFTPPPA